MLPAPCAKRADLLFAPRVCSAARGAKHLPAGVDPWRENLFAPQEWSNHRASPETGAL